MLREKVTNKRSVTMVAHLLNGWDLNLSGLYKARKTWFLQCTTRPQAAKHPRLQNHHVSTRVSQAAAESVFLGRARVPSSSD